MAASASAKTDSDPIRAGLERTLASGEFANSERMRRFLRFIVEETLAGRGDCLKETQIGIHVFDRVPGYDPKADAIVRVEARRLRSKLLEYAEQHRADPLVIELPKGGYLPAFRWRELSFETPKAAIPAELRRKFAWRWAVIPGVALLAGIIIASYWLGGRHQSFAAMQVRPFTTYPGYELGPAFSPDGENIAFCWAGPDGELDAIWVQAVQSDTPRRVTHSNFGEARPVWSPDGKQLAFLRTLSKDRSGVFIISVDGRNERKITEIAHTTAIGRVDWSPDGKYLVTSDQRSPGGPSSIVLLSLATAEPQRLTDPDSRIPGDTEPSFSPDGRTIAFRHSIGNAVDDIYLAPMPAAGTSLPLRSSHLKRLTFDNRGIDGHTWAPDGRSLIVSSTRGAGIHSLWRFRLSGGPPVRLSEAGLDAVQPSASLHGHRLAYVTEINDQNIWQDSIPTSAARVLIASTLLDSSPQFSPDGSQVVAGRYDGSLSTYKVR